MRPLVQQQANILSSQQFCKYRMRPRFPEFICFSFLQLEKMCIEFSILYMQNMFSLTTRLHRLLWATEFYSTHRFLNRSQGNIFKNGKIKSQKDILLRSSTVFNLMYFSMHNQIFKYYSSLWSLRLIGNVYANIVHRISALCLNLSI